MICENIRKIRIEKGLSQEELAKRSNTTKQYISILEKGKTKNPGITILKRIAKALDVSIEEL